MALYLGGTKVKINLAGIAYKLNLRNTAPTIVGTSLLSSDNYILIDSNGVYLLPKIEANEQALLFSDDYVLNDVT